MASPDQWKGKSLQLHGFVVKGTWGSETRHPQYRFKVEDKGKVVRASYTGVVPDTFKDEAEVVLKGRLNIDATSRVDPDGTWPSAHQGQEEARRRSEQSTPATRRWIAKWLHWATSSLLATFVVCAYAAVVSVVGARRGSRRLVESGIGAFYLVTALMIIASALIIHAFVTDDFSVRDVSTTPIRSSRCFSRSPRMGRARRLDDVLGGPARKLRQPGGAREPRPPSRADPVRGRGDQAYRCSSCS